MAKQRPWIRLYTEVPNDPKVQRLPAELFKFWINCLCLAGSNHGTLPPDEDVAFILRISTDRVTSFISKLVEAGLIDWLDDTCYFPHNWNSRQFNNDVSTGRVRDYRKRVKKAGMAVGGYLVHRENLSKRDEGKCVYCGDSKNLCIDHVVPIVLGGDDDPSNLAICCKSCNSGKSGRTPAMAGMSVLPESAYAKLYSNNMSRLQQQPVTVPCLFPVTVTETNLSPSHSGLYLSSESVVVSSSTENTNPEVSPIRRPQPRGYALDEQYAQFREACISFGMNVIDSDFTGPAWYRWVELDTSQRAEAIGNILARQAAGMDPLLTKRPENFLKSREFKRPIVALKSNLERLMDSV